MTDPNEWLDGDCVTVIGLIYAVVGAGAAALSLLAWWLA